LSTNASRQEHPARGKTLALLCLIQLASASLHATTIFNGSFEDIGTAVASFSISNPTVLPGWTATPSGNKVLDCLVRPSDTDRLCGTPNGWTLQFWNAGAGGNFPGGPSPDGGNFVAIDGDANFESAMTQTLTGLIVGHTYRVSFYQAAAQQYTYNGATTERWQVSLGTETHLSTLMNTANHGFVNWMSQSLTFTAQNTTDVLSFFAIGTPSGLPPFVLLDGVSITETPEPTATSLVGLGGLALLLAKWAAWKRR
jgi:hypothetical protein